jgi:hypothetical protein
MRELNSLIEGGDVITAAPTCMTVLVDGIEVHVAARIDHSGCACCADMAELTMSYNRPQDVDGDPLGLK